MDLLEIFKSGLKDSPFSDDLGNRLEYVGASDVAGCPRKAVLSKTDEPVHDLGTLIRFAKGHLSESLLLAGLKKHRKSLPEWKHQYEARHKSKDHLRAHLDFLFKSKDILAVLEVKSVDGIPADPYESWICQVHFQMGLVCERFPEKIVKGAVLAIDLNKGEAKLFNGYQYDSRIFQGLVRKAEHIWQGLQHPETHIETEKGPLCAGLSGCIGRR